MGTHQPWLHGRAVREADDQPHFHGVVFAEGEKISFLKFKRRTQHGRRAYQPNRLYFFPPLHKRC
jgi:hypothetical protein